MDRLCPSHVIVDIFCIATLNFAWPNFIFIACQNKPTFMWPSSFVAVMDLAVTDRADFRNHGVCVDSVTVQQY